MTTRIPILLFAALATVGCKKMKASAAMAPGDYRNGAEFERDYDAVADGEDSYKASMAMEDERADMAGEPPREVMAAPAPAVDGGATREPAVANDRPGKDISRFIVYTATLSMSVFNVSEALDKAESVPERHGGWVASMDSETLVLKIPSKHLKPAMAELAKMGVVEHETLQSADVSDRYLDLETRIAVLEQTQAQMLALLTKARDVKEALAVRKALDEVTMQLEVLKGQFRKLSNQVAFSTLTLSLHERGPHDPTPSSNDPFDWVDALGVEATEWR